MQKKLALALYFFNSAKTKGVASGCGPSQIHKIKADKNLPQEIIMWDVLSGDFDLNLSPEACTKNVIKNTSEGSIVVFHDSDKAFERLKIALPAVLAHFTNLGYTFEAIQ